MVLQLHFRALSMVLAVVAAVSICPAGPIKRVKAASGGSNVNILTTHDSAGNQWMILQGGMIQQRGNMPIYGQGAILLINGENVQNPATALGR